MSGVMSARTAAPVSAETTLTQREVIRVLAAWDVAMRVTAANRNGVDPAVLDALRRKLVLLRDLAPPVSAVDGTVLGIPALAVGPSSVDVATAAGRLGLRPRAVRKRCAAGTLTARKVGRMWLVEMGETDG